MGCYPAKQLRTHPRRAGWDDQGNRIRSFRRATGGGGHQGARIFGQLTHVITDRLCSLVRIFRVVCLLQQRPRAGQLFSGFLLLVFVRRRIRFGFFTCGRLFLGGLFRHPLRFLVQLLGRLFLFCRLFTGILPG